MPVYKSNKKTKDGRTWYFRISTTIDGKRTQYRSPMYMTKSEAVEEEAKYKLRSNLFVEEDKTIKALANEYLEYQKSRVKHSTLYSIKKRMNCLIKTFKDKKLKSITLADIEKWKNSFPTTWSATYKNNMISTIKTLNNFSYKIYNVRNNAFDKVDYFKDREIKKELQFFTIEEFNMFIEKIEELNLKAFFTTLFYCGLRRGEALALTWNDYSGKELRINKTLSDIFIKGKPVIQTPKNKSSVRTIPIPNQVKTAIEKWYNHIKTFEGFSKDWFLFRDYESLTTTTITRVKNKACKEANLHQIRIHDFRHSTASLLINNGAKINLVANYLGHSDIKMTLNTYSHLYESELENIVERINNLEKRGF